MAADDHISVWSVSALEMFLQLPACEHGAPDVGRVHSAKLHDAEWLLGRENLHNGFESDHTSFHDPGTIEICRSQAVQGPIGQNGHVTCHGNC